MLKLDSIDLAIIRALQKDGRRTFTGIAHDLGVPTSVVYSRFSKMKEKGLITGCTILVNLAKIGYKHHASIGIETAQSEVEKVVEYVNGLTIVDGLIITWMTMGRYNIASLIMLRDVIELHRIRQLIKQHPAVIDVNVSLTTDVSLAINLPTAHGRISLEHLAKE